MRAVSVFLQLLQVTVVIVEHTKNPHFIVKQRSQKRFGFSVKVGVFRGTVIGSFINNGTPTFQRYLEITRHNVEPLLRKKHN